jgi:hypothetical protein
VDTALMGRRRYPYVMHGRPRVRERPTAADAPDRRVADVTPGISTARSIRDIVDEQERTYHLDADLVVVDQILRRWAVSIGSGMPMDEAESRTQSKPPPLDDERAIITDQLILRAPLLIGEILRLWYKTPLSLGGMAKRLGVKTKHVVARWRGSLRWLRQRLVDSRVIHA